MFICNQNLLITLYVIAKEIAFTNISMIFNCEILLLKNAEFYLG